YTLRSETAPAEKTSPLKENLPLITLIIMMALSWGLEQINHPFSPANRQATINIPGTRATPSPAKRSRGILRRGREKRIN
ncbi:hypothetical protein NL511_31315, partial [Klebsiella pneumoniae]|nr:hypothetical protein [Klebsiella pneumoniae]